MTKKADPKPTATDLLRERLKKVRAKGQPLKAGGASGATTVRNQFGNGSTGSTARKSRKGMRPG